MRRRDRDLQSDAEPGPRIPLMGAQSPNRAQSGFEPS